MHIFVIGPYRSGKVSAAQLVHGCGFYIGKPQESTAVDISAKDGPWQASSRQVLLAAMAQRHWQAEVTDGLLPDTDRVKFAVAPTEPSTIMPTRDKVNFLHVYTIREP